MSDEPKKPRGWNADPAMKRIPDHARPIVDPTSRKHDAKAVQAEVAALAKQYAPKDGAK